MSFWVIKNRPAQLQRSQCLSGQSQPCFAKASCLRRLRWRKDAHLRSSHVESDSHFQLQLFLFLFTTTISRTVTGSQGEKEREKLFSSKRISYLNKWAGCVTCSQLACWKLCGQIEIYSASRKYSQCFSVSTFYVTALFQNWTNSFYPLNSPMNG